MKLFAWLNAIKIILEIISAFYPAVVAFIEQAVDGWQSVINTVKDTDVDDTVIEATKAQAATDVVSKTLQEFSQSPTMLSSWLAKAIMELIVGRNKIQDARDAQREEYKMNKMQEKYPPAKDQIEKIKQIYPQLFGRMD